MAKWKTPPKRHQTGNSIATALNAIRLGRIGRNAYNRYLGARVASTRSSTRRPNSNTKTKTKNKRKRAGMFGCMQP